MFILPNSYTKMLIATIENNGQTNLAKGDIARLSYWPGPSVVALFVPVNAYGTPILGEKEVASGQRWYHSKKRWWFPIDSPLWPLHYL